MLDSNLDDDPDFTKLEAQLRTKSEPTEDELSTAEVAALKLAQASDLLKRSATLLSFLSDENFCKSLTKRYREIMDKQVDAIYTLTEELDETVSFIEESEDEEEEADV